MTQTFLLVTSANTLESLAISVCRYGGMILASVPVILWGINAGVLSVRLNVLVPNRKRWNHILWSCRTCLDESPSHKTADTTTLASVPFNPQIYMERRQVTHEKCSTIRDSMRLEKHFSGQYPRSQHLIKKIKMTHQSPLS